MSKQTVEGRLSTLEAEVARLKRALLEKEPLAELWWERIRGRFKDDPVYEEAMRYGREYRHYSGNEHCIVGSPYLEGRGLGG